MELNRLFGFILEIITWVYKVGITIIPEMRSTTSNSYNLFIMDLNTYRFLHFSTLKKLAQKFFLLY